MDYNQPSSKEEDQNILFQKPTFIDPLTGLFNRFYLSQFLPQETEKAKLGNYELAFLMVDLDGFKQVNDNHGHLCGDAVLKQMAEVFKKRVRRSDAVIRYAGDEFVLLLPAVSAEKARDIANQIIGDMAAAVFKGPQDLTLHLTLSIGFSIFPSDANEIDKLIDVADKALYLSKQRGKNRVSHAKEVTLEEVSSVAAMDSFPCRKFIDRQDEISRLRQIFDIVSTSNLLQAAFITGESGVGKSRIMEEAKSFLRQKARVIDCFASEEQSQDPYRLFARGIGNYLDEVGVDSLQIRPILSNMPVEELAELALIIPQLSKVVSVPPNYRFQDSKSRFLLFKAFLDLLIELNKNSIIVLAFDDIHLADKPSIELLRYLIHEEKNKRIFVIASLTQNKSKPLPDSGNIQQFMKEISYSDIFTEITVGNLSRLDTREMLNVIFPLLGENEKFVELLYTVTGGNPCFIEEVLKSLVDSGLLVYLDNNWKTSKEITREDIPASLEEVIKRRVKNLDEETKEMILQAAVIGDNFNAGLLKKVGNKDEGFLSELVNRAKKMHLLDESKEGNLNFSNKNIQGVLYNELADAERQELHYKVGRALAEQHGNNLYNVAGELSFHFAKSPVDQGAGKLDKAFRDMAQEIYDPQEILEYVKMLAKGLSSAEEGAVVEINPEEMKEVIKLIRAFQGAIKIFRLYPAHSAIKVTSIKEAFDLVNAILLNRTVGRINISEFEKSLVINNKRVSPKELQEGNIENFLLLMMERNIKTISFVKGLKENEIDSLVECLGSEPGYVIENGGWTGALAKAGIEHIKIQEVTFYPGTQERAQFERRGNLENAMLMEFLLGKIDPTAADRNGLIASMKNDPRGFAAKVTEIAESSKAEGRVKDKAEVVNSLIEKMRSQVLTEGEPDKYNKELSKVVEGLDPALRNKVIRSNLSNSETKQRGVFDNVISNMPDEVLVDIIAEEYKEGRGGLSKVKEFIKEILPDESRRKRLMPRLEERLSELNVSKEDASFIAGRLDWKELSASKKIDNLIQESSEGSSAIDSLKIKGVLEDLTSPGKKEELENAIQQLLLYSDKADYLGRKAILAGITDFAKADFASGSRDAGNRLFVLLDRLRVETDQKNFSQLLDMFSEAINVFLEMPESKDMLLELENPLVKRYLFFINRLFCLLQGRLNLKEEHHQPIHECIRNFILQVSNARFLEAFALSLVNSSPSDSYDIEYITQIIGEPLIDTFIHLGSERLARLNDPFKGYVVQKKILDLFTKMGERVYNRLKVVLSEESRKGEPDISLIEFVGYLKSESLVECLSPFSIHKNPVVRLAALRALSEIGTGNAMEIISQMAETDKDKKIRAVAREQLKGNK